MNLDKISKKLNLNIDIQENINISGLNTLANATSSEISFVENKKYLKDLKNTNAAAVFINEEFSSLVPANTIALVTP